MKIKWVVGELEVPNIGVAVIGGVVDVDEDAAMSLISQGLAIEYLTRKQPKSTAKEEGGV